MNKLQGNILVFDLETTGLPPTRKAPTQSDLDQWPYIIQLSAVLYNTHQGNVKSYLNYYVKTDQNITEEIIKITGITNEDCREKGRPIHEVIASFYELYTRADYIVAHNFEFDSRVFLAEIMRQPSLPEYMAKMFSPRTGSGSNAGSKHDLPITICTMERYRYVCGIPAVSAKGYRYTKMPKLSEVYDLVFQTYQKKASDYSLHNSMVDTLICLRILLFFECGQSIHEDLFEKMIKSCSPHMDKPLYGIMTRYHSIYKIN